MKAKADMRELEGVRPERKGDWGALETTRRIDEGNMVAVVLFFFGPILKTLSINNVGAGRRGYKKKKSRKSRKKRKRTLHTYSITGM